MTDDDRRMLSHALMGISILIRTEFDRERFCGPPITTGRAAIERHRAKLLDLEMWLRREEEVNVR
jgi:hypothetical protein